MQASKSVYLDQQLHSLQDKISVDIVRVFDVDLSLDMVLFKQRDNLVHLDKLELQELLLRELVQLFLVLLQGVDDPERLVKVSHVGVLLLLSRGLLRGI